MRLSSRVYEKIKKRSHFTVHFFPKNDWHSFRIFLIQIDKAHRVVDDAVDRDTLMKHNFVLKTWHTLEIIWISKRSRKRTRTICSRKKKKESKKHSVVLLTTGCLKKKVRINQLVKKKSGGKLATLSEEQAFSFSHFGSGPLKASLLTWRGPSVPFMDAWLIKMLSQGRARVHPKKPVLKALRSGRMVFKDRSCVCFSDPPEKSHRDPPSAACLSVESAYKRRRWFKPNQGRITACSDRRLGTHEDPPSLGRWHPQQKIQ